LNYTFNMEEAILKKRRRIRAREYRRFSSKERIIEKAFERWRELNELNIYQSDAEVALFLLDR